MIIENIPLDIDGFGDVQAVVEHWDEEEIPRTANNPTGGTRLVIEEVKLTIDYSQLSRANQMRLDNHLKIVLEKRREEQEVERQL